MTRRLWPCLLAISMTTSALGQEEGDGATPAPEPAATEAAPSEAAPTPASPTAAEFERLFKQWKDVIVELQGLRVKFRTASPGDKDALKQQYKDGVAQGQKLLEQMRDEALTAYEAEPNKDPRISEFLASAAAEAFGRDDHEMSWKLVKPLIDNNATLPEIGEVREAAGVSAFALNDFDNAEKLLKESDAAGWADQNNRAYLDQLDSYRQYWEREKALREAEAKADDLPRVLLKTSKGDILIELFENEAPNAVANFLSLVEQGFYDNTVFHRVLPGFMAQGGDPKGTGEGGPGYNIACECYQDNKREHFRGSLSMAHGGRDTGGSQFFLTFRPTPHLNGKHTVFGRVLEGFDTLANLQRIDPEKPRPYPPDKIITATVVRKRDHAYEPKKL